MEATIYTDGSCYWKKKLGGYGVYIVEESGKERFFKKGFANTTSQRMEVRAIIKALQVSEIYSKIVIWSDSEYCVKAFNEGRLEKWLGVDFNAVKNADLWKQVVEELLKSNFKFEINHTNGHRKDIEDPVAFGNAVADQLADYRNHKNYIKDGEKF